MALLNKADIVNQSFTQGALAFNEMYASLIKGLDPWSDWVYTQATKTGTVDFGFMMDVPQFRRTVGAVAFSDIAARNYTVDVEDFSCGIKLHKNELNDDLQNIIEPRINSMVAAPPRTVEMLAFDALLKGIATTTYGACADAGEFFDNAHPVGGGTFSNYTAGGGSTAWYLLDCSDPISKPLVLALREDPEMERESVDSSHYFSTGECRFKVEGRMQIGYGMWQRAFCDTNALTEARIDDAIQKMRAYTNESGEYLGVYPTHLLVAPDTELTARKLLQRTRLPSEDTTGTTDYVTASNEVVRGMGLKLVVSPWLA